MLLWQSKKPSPLANTKTKRPSNGATNQGKNMEIIKASHIGDTVKYGQYTGVVLERNGYDALVEFKKTGSVQWIETQYLTVVRSAA